MQPNASDSFSIRQASLADLDAVLALWLKLEAEKTCQPFGGDCPDSLHERSRSLVEHSITSETALALIAEQDGKTVATLSAYVYEKPAVVLPSVAVIYCVWVEPEVRRLGLASRLLEQAGTDLRALGAQSLQVAWDSDNAVAARFWQAQGFEPYEVIASKLL